MIYENEPRFREREKASLDLSLGTDISSSSDEFLYSLLNIRPRVNIGLSYSPVTRVEKENLEVDRRVYGARIELLEKEIEVLEETIETSVTSFLVQVSELEKIIELNRQLIELGEEKAVEEARLYNEGKNTLTNVIQSRDSVQAQKEKLADNFAQYHRLVIQYRALMDQLLKE